MRYLSPAERPRERLLQSTATQLSDAELLAILFGHGYKHFSALDLAKQLLKNFTSLRHLFAADFKKINTIDGLGPVRYCILQATQELGRRLQQEPFKRYGYLNSPQATKEFLLAALSHYEHEVFAVLLLDAKNQLIKFHELFHGGISSTQVHPREVVKCALQHNAVAVIAAHNHPSGNIEPSPADEILTKSLQQSLALIEIRLLDHIIVGANDTCSMAERGLLLDSQITCRI